MGELTQLGLADALTIPDAQLVRIWQAVVRGDKGALLEHPWKPLSGVPPYERDFYRVGNGEIVSLITRSGNLGDARFQVRDRAGA